MIESVDLAKVTEKAKNQGVRCDFLLFVGCVGDYEEGV